MHFADLTDVQSVNSDYDWDYLIFTQSWPVTVCKDWKHNKPNHGCNYPKTKGTWTIHGIWPTKGSSGPEGCNSTWLFDPEQVRPIEDQLEQSWPDVHKGDGIYNLWAHEWNKHGTCAAILESFNSEFKYFNKGLDLHKQYSMNDILQDAKILPSDTKTVSFNEINEALVSKLGKTPSIRCKYEDHIQYLFELRICFDKEMNLIDCSEFTNCNVKADIFYPEQDTPKSLDFAHLTRVQRLNAVPLENDWDILIFSQKWPSTACKAWKHNKPTHSCNFPSKKDSWTVHGVWPTKIGTRGPENCNGTWLFDPEKVKPIEDELEQSWTNIEKGTGLYDLWSHEWTKHGTCAAAIEPLNSEVKYFGKGLELHKRYSMSDVLSEANINPSDTKPVIITQINEVLLSKFGKKPIIQCKYEDHIQYIFELRVCFDKQLNLIDCSVLLKTFKNLRDVDGVLTNCNVNADIIYPEQDPPKRQLVQLYKFVSWLQWFTL